MIFLTTHFRQDFIRWNYIHSTNMDCIKIFSYRILSDSRHNVNHDKYRSNMKMNALSYDCEWSPCVCVHSGFLIKTIEHWTLIWSLIFFPPFHYSSLCLVFTIATVTSSPIPSSTIHKYRDSKISRIQPYTSIYSLPPPDTDARDYMQNENDSTVKYADVSKFPDKYHKKFGSQSKKKTSSNHELLKWVIKNRTKRMHFVHLIL